VYTALAAIIALAPPAETTFDVSDIDLHRTDEAVQITTYDSDGEVSADIVLWVDDGRVHFDANFADGLYSLTMVDGDRAWVDSNDPAAVGLRGTVIRDFLRENEQDGWVPCAAAAIGASLHCWNVLIAWCVADVYIMGCECLPELIEEFEEIECPGFG
jgi:hypothetical protein